MRQGSPSDPRGSGSLVQPRRIDAALGARAAVPGRQALPDVGPLRPDLRTTRRVGGKTGRGVVVSVFGTTSEKTTTATTTTTTTSKA